MSDASVLLDFCKAEKAIGLGCRAEHNRTVDIGLNVHMNNHRIIGLGSPLETGDALSKGYADSTYCRPVLLWMNPAPADAFPAQTLEISAAGFRFLMVVSGFEGTSGNCSSVLCPMGMNGQSMIHQRGKLAVRNFEGNDQEITFGDGCLDTEQDNRHAVPLRIYGM